MESKRISITSPAKRRLRGILVAVVLACAVYWMVTYAAIQYCAHDLTRTHGCCYLLWSSGDETRFLIAMGRRSVRPVVRQIERPDVSLETKVHLAWILSSIGDHRYFNVFLQGLRSNSPLVRYIAAVRMGDFEDQCRQRVPAILQCAVEKPQHSYFWGVVLVVAEGTSLSKGDKQKLQQALRDAEWSSGHLETLTKAQKEQILKLFARKPTE